MQGALYQDFDNIIQDSRQAFEYAKQQFNELMARPVAHILYGPATYGPGIGQPSQRITPYKDRIVNATPRRKKFKAYYFDCNWDLLYSRSFSSKTKIDYTIVHFWIGDTNYARWFFEDRNAFYKSEVFSTKYLDGRPVRFAMAHEHRVYVEYLQDTCKDNGELLTLCNWFDYAPTRTVAVDGTILATDAPFGTETSPVKTGREVFMSIDMDFSHWNNGSFPWCKLG